MQTETRAAYLLDHDWDREPSRLELLEAHADPTTVRRLEEAGVARGWDCLEVGAGRGSIARWLGQRVGWNGSVTALDLDTSLLTGLDEPNVDVVAGDVLEIELPERSFDLIHTRLVLMHVPERRRAIDRMVSWLRPGGVLVLEELDCMAIRTNPDPEMVALWDAFDRALPTIDFECGRALISEVGAAGLVDVASDVRVDVIAGASDLAEWTRLSIQALTDDILAAGTATLEQIDQHLAQLADPEYRSFGWTWTGVRGRRST